MEINFCLFQCSRNIECLSFPQKNSFDIFGNVLAKSSAGLDKKVYNQDFLSNLKKDHRNAKKLKPEHCT